MRDTGLVLGLFCLVIGYSGGRVFLVVSGVLITLALLVPRTLYPLAWVWLKLVHILGLVIPKIFFGLVFFVVIVPIGLMRKVINGDTLLIKGWKGAETSFNERRVRFAREHLETPY